MVYRNAWLWLFAFVVGMNSSLVVAAPAPAHDQFRVAVYIPVFVVQRMKDPAYLRKSWEELSSQVKVDKVYIETYRSGTIADDANLEQVKAFFASQNVQTAGGIAYVGRGDTAGADAPDDNGGQFVSMCYTDPKQREYVKNIAEITARVEQLLEGRS